MIFNPKIEIGRRTRASFPIPAFAISFSSFVNFVFFVVGLSSLSAGEPSIESPYRGLVWRTADVTTRLRSQPL